MFPVVVGAAPLAGRAGGLLRVRLGVHYPSDVVVGQLLATLTMILVLAVG